MAMMVREELLQSFLQEARQRNKFTQGEVASRLGKPQSFVSKYESGERRLDVIEFMDVCGAISVNPHDILRSVYDSNDRTPSLFERWKITEAELTHLVDSNPSLRGIMLGYVAEKKFHDAFLDHPEITEKGKDDDHDRKKKGDRRVTYKKRTLTIEVKSLQTAMVKQLGEDQWSGKAQVDASDRRIVKFPDGTELNTTLLLRGEFDLLAINCFAFGGKWRFVFAKNSDLPCSTFKKYTEAQMQGLIASLVSITWPPIPPFTDNPFPLLDELAAQPDKTVNLKETSEGVLADQPVIEVEPSV